MDTESHEPKTPHNPATADPATEDLPVGAVPDDCRHDGWTAFNRRLFLEVLSETGRVKLGCDYCRMSPQSAYALRARDPVFAASWDAACELARQPLADALYERALGGVVDTISKDGEVVAERHRFDSRLSIAVLHRLDKRCDRAADLGARHLLLAANWNEWLGMVGKGEDLAAGQGLFVSAQHHQLHQLSLGQSPTGDAADDDDGDGSIDLTDRCWFDEVDEVWMTDFPPPKGFSGYQSCDYGDPDRTYQRECTDEEAAILDRDEAAERAQDRAEEEALRDEWFKLLATGPAGHGGGS